jgi:hypothetical protein
VLATSAADAFDRFERAKNDDLLVRGVHHKEAAGRRFCDILGALGDEIQSPSDCPEQIMPLWLAQAAFRLFAGQSLDSAKAWGSQFYAELKRLNGTVPFSVVYDWHANVVAPFVIRLSRRPEPNPWSNLAPATAMQALHTRTLGGDTVAADEWHRVLYDAFSHIFAGRMSVNLNNIDLNNLGRRQDMEKFFHGPRLAEANARAYSGAFASADAAGYARANADPTSVGFGLDSYAHAALTAYSILSVHAMFLAYQGPSPPYDYYNGIKSKDERIGFAALAQGLLQCLTRVAQ